MAGVVISPVNLMLSHVGTASAALSPAISLTSVGSCARTVGDGQASNPTVIAITVVMTFFRVFNLVIIGFFLSQFYTFGINLIIECK